MLDAAGNAEDAEGPFAAGPASAQGVLQVPVLTVTKTPLKASVAAGEEDSYTIVIHNTGAGVAREVLAEDTLPAGMTYKAGSATASPTTGFSEKSASATKVVWEVASIAAGASVEIEGARGHGSEPRERDQTEEHCRGARHGGADPGRSIGDDHPDHERRSRPPRPAVAGKGVSAVPGHEITYEVAATNKGPSLAREVKLVDHLPTGLTYKLSSTPGAAKPRASMTCDAGNLAVTQKRAIPDRSPARR